MSNTVNQVLIHRSTWTSSEGSTRYGDIDIWSTHTIWRTGGEHDEDRRREVSHIAEQLDGIQADGEVEEKEAPP